MQQDAVKATIITIGDELLIGQVIDTNSAFIAQELNKAGIWVRKRVAVGDVYEDIWKTLEEESPQANVILITGGLGPTADDITKPLLCDYFGGKMIVDEEVLKHVRHLFENVFKRPFTERNVKQAEVPDVCTVIPNPRGTAPGMLFEKNGCLYISMPGVPHEMKGMMTRSVIPELTKRFRSYAILHRTILTAGIGESFLADHIQAWENALPSNMKLAYLPNYGMVRLRLTASGVDKAKLEHAIDIETEKLRELVKDWLAWNGDLSMPQIVSTILKQRKQTLSTAESCTGGYIAHLITQEPGSSEIFKGSVISYANQVKEDLLDVHNEILEQYGAVSEQTVKQMARGALAALKTDYAVAVSGIMGPTGGTEEKPVGLVWVAVGNKDHIEATSFNFRFDRNRNIEMTAANALNFLRKFILAASS
ncbi:MAG TPA: competence/damage-inducible protein A [Flavitalea sp.]|nr:competence/damage-inducible protein A [Flavitalea sp.]